MRVLRTWEQLRGLRLCVSAFPHLPLCTTSTTLQSNYDADDRTRRISRSISSPSIPSLFSPARICIGAFPTSVELLSRLQHRLLLSLCSGERESALSSGSG
ncbi:hypothetical protein BJV78DRAFT_1209152 [Lactifluus subvellereus]|nr:hypothetical protein BJV78DRAFT_1209152 [Lactifluus subvellereus]